MDRNDVIRPAIDVFLASLSARRAWIEITMRRDFKALGLVALRKESVDRNSIQTLILHMAHLSLSARRAWIEIQVGQKRFRQKLVALRKESVDRNHKLNINRTAKTVALRKESVDRNRYHFATRMCIIKSLSARRAWIEIQLVALC